MKKKIILMALSVLMVLSLVGCGKEKTTSSDATETKDVVYEDVDMAWLEQVRADYDNNQFAAKDYDQKPIRITLEISEIYSEGFFSTYGWQSLSQTRWADKLPVVFTDPSVLGNYSLKNKVTVTGILVMGESAHGTIGAEFGIKDATIVQ